MELNNFFSQQCNAAGVLLGVPSPSVKSVFNGKKKEKTGSAATFHFDGYNLVISFIERGRAAYAQQTIWLSFVLDADTTLPYSVYDILAFIEPENFNSYTYTYVDSCDLMRECFGEIIDLLERLAPKLTEFLRDGRNKNRLIDTQKKAVNTYFGDSVLESGEMIGSAADKLINMMLLNFQDAQIEAAVVGSQAEFYNGNEQKALKKLKKSKYRTLYHENLIMYLENGGNSQNISDVVHRASVKKGAMRHGQTNLGVLKKLGLSILMDIPVSVCLAVIFKIITSVMFRGADFYSGFYENLFLMPCFGIFLSAGIVQQLSIRKRKTKSKKTDGIQSPEVPARIKTMCKYLTVFGECFALLGCMTSVYSTAVFHNDRLYYSEEEFPLSHQECLYEAIDTIALVNQPTSFGTQDKYIAIKTKSGSVIDLTYSTFLTADDIIENISFADEYGITVLQINSIEELK